MTFDRSIYGLPTTPGSVVRATIFGQPNLLATLSMDALDPSDQAPWLPLDSSLVGETYVAWKDLHDAVVVFDAGTSDVATEAAPVREVVAFPDKMYVAEVIEANIEKQRRRDGYFDAEELAMKIIAAIGPAVPGPAPVDASVRDQVAKTLAYRDRFAWGSVSADDRDWYRGSADKVIELIAGSQATTTEATHG